MFFGFYFVLLSLLHLVSSFILSLLLLSFSLVYLISFLYLFLSSFILFSSVFLCSIHSLLFFPFFLFFSLCLISFTSLSFSLFAFIRFFVALISRLISSPPCSLFFLFYFLFFLSFLLYFDGYFICLIPTRHLSLSPVACWREPRKSSR